MNLFHAMRAFVVTVQNGSFTAAASDLRLSPAMVGQLVAALENRLGTRLLVRTTRRQSLTDFGVSYFEQCRDILDRVSLAEHAAEVEHTAPRGHLRITAPKSFGAEVLMPALAEYAARAPEVTLDIILNDRNVDMVDDGLDVAFRIGALSDSSLIARPLAPYRMIICAAPSYLAQHGRLERPEEISVHEAVVFTPAARSAWRLSKEGRTVEVSPSRRISVNSGQAVRTAARAGLGLILQPEILVASDIRNGHLEHLFSDWDLPERPMSLLYYRDRQMTPRLKSFIAFAVELFGRPSPRIVSEI